MDYFIIKAAFPCTHMRISQVIRIIQVIYPPDTSYVSYRYMYNIDNLIFMVPKTNSPFLKTEAFSVYLKILSENNEGN